MLYGQDISHLSQEQLASLTSIGNPLLTVPVGISDKNDVGASATVVLEATFQNTDLKADLPYSAVGFFAKRGNDAEKLVVVGVANSDACLVAASPDGVATDALDIKVAIAIGDATSVTAVIDPAGSVTPATLSSAISKATHGLTDQIATKADAKTVNDAIGKIDFTPYAKSEDVTALQNKVNVNTPLFREISADSTWEDIFGVTNPNNVLTSLRINPGGSGQLVNDFAAGIGFGGNDTKAVITVDYGSHVARFTAGNGTAPSWSEDVAFKSDINSTNQTVSALQQTVKTLTDTVNKQAQTITGLQTQVSNQTNEISYIKANYIEGKRFSKADESQATAWEKENSQRIAFITDN
ncbi:hypothetical protein [Lactobacillus crispatus]|uniref:hypothetical protein n=1 Tax=Lactobacillus crispatus TaxID=47770 RepID=UPI003F28DC1B